MDNIEVIKKAIKHQNELRCFTNFWILAQCQGLRNRLTKNLITIIKALTLMKHTYGARSTSILEKAVRLMCSYFSLHRLHWEGSATQPESLSALYAPAELCLRYKHQVGCQCICHESLQ